MTEVGCCIHLVKLFIHFPERELDPDDLKKMDPDVIKKIDAMTDMDNEIATFGMGNYPTRRGSSTDEHMCDKVLNYVPRHLTFITK